MQIYDAGRRYAVPWAPAQPGSSPEYVQIGIDDRGRGVAVSGRDSTAYQSLRDARHVSLSKAEYAEGGFFFSRNADAVLRFFKPDALGPSLAFLPTASSSVFREFELRAPASLWTDSQWAIVTAANAPILFWIEQRESPVRVDGVVQAVAYPSDLGDTLSVSEPVVLATGVLEGRQIADGSRSTRVSNSAWCTGRVCASPSGRVLSTMEPDTHCVLRTWSWVGSQADAEQEVVSQLVPLPEGCRWDDDPWLIAQIDDDVFVLDDDERIYVVDLRTDATQAVPKLGDGLGTVLVRDRGRVVLYVAQNGQVVYADASGPRLLSTEQTFCIQRDGVVASPSGNWVVQTCGHGGAFDLAAPISRTGTVVRVSALGVETFAGVQMRALAVDDEGNVLLYSYKNDGGTPRTLFVLSGDGQLARVDGLDPTPAPVVVSGTELFDRFVAAPIE